MIVMARVLVLVTLLVAAAPADAVQQAVRLSVTVVLVDASGAVTPVPRHALLISDSPPSAPPLRIVTAPDGTAGLNLRPGRYIVESEQSVAFEGLAFSWIQTVEVAGGHDAILELTVDNAIVEPISASTFAAMAGGRDAPPEAGSSDLLLRWQDSVVAIWTPIAHASGVLIDRRGLVATSQRAVGTATAVEVQLAPAVKVAGTVVVTDRARDVAIVRVNPAVVSGSPVPLECAPGAPLPVDGQEVLTIGARLRGARDTSIGTVRHLTPHAVAADFDLRDIGPGGPVLAEDGSVVGITSIGEADDAQLRGDSPIVLLDEICAAVQSAEDTMRQTAPPDDTHLPVEPVTSVPLGVLEDAVSRRAGSLNPYAMSSSAFDIAFITPVLAYAALRDASRPTMDFSNWSDYVRDVPAVLLVRVTPKQSESFWMKLARGAAWTQGASLPPITHFKPGFARLRAFCGETEVTPVHPFILELRLSETEAVHEGLFAFAPDALGPQCGSVRLMLFSEEEPGKGETRMVDPGLLRQIWQDFAPYRMRRPSAEDGVGPDRPRPLRPGPSTPATLHVGLGHAQ